MHVSCTVHACITQVVFTEEGRELEKCGKESAGREGRKEGEEERGGGEMEGGREQEKGEGGREGGERERE